MTKFVLIPICLLFAEVTSAQNAFLDLFHLRYNSLVSLRTDSLYIRDQDPVLGTVTREIGYDYPGSENTLTNWSELRRESIGSKIFLTTQNAESSAGNKVIITEKLDSLTLVTRKDRTVIFGSNPSLPDSVLYDLWDGNYWKPIQKTLFTYNPAQQVTGRTEWRWDGTQWLGVQGAQFTYDGTARLTKREDVIWSDDQWVNQNSYHFTYNGTESHPHTTVWRTYNGPKSATVDSTLVWYDGQGLPDSSIAIGWNEADSSWHTEWRRVMSNAEQKRAQDGKKYNPGGGPSVWQVIEETVFTPGEGIYTDEPQEILFRTYDAPSHAWKDKRRETTQYTSLSDTLIYGTIRIEEVSDSMTWEEVFFVEGWFTLDQARPEPDSLQERMSQFTFSYTCGLLNPYVQNQTLSFPANEAIGDYELKIFSDDGRLVFHQYYDSSGVGIVNAPLTPGFYIVTVNRGGTPLCTQKLVVR